MSDTNRNRLADFTERIAHQLAGLIEEHGPGGWTKPWRDAGCVGALYPTNASTGKAYRGSNVWQLAAVALEQTYPTGTWATYRQWQSLGVQVRRGEKGTPGVKWTPVRTAADDDAVAGVATVTRLVPRWFTVFNAAQVDGYEPVAAAAWDPEERAERFFAAVGADVRHGGDRAYYSGFQDFIGVPERGQFGDDYGYYSTLAHEHVHWTGHKTRLDRDLNGRFGSEAYAWEELVAELGCAVLCSRLDLDNEPRPDHARYLASWVKGLRETPKAVLTVTTKASDAVEYLERLGLAHEADTDLSDAPARGIAA